MNIVVFLISFCMMEFISWFTHKYIMHGIGWKLHRDHHVKAQHTFFEKNDFFFLIFAIPGFVLLLAGTFSSYNILFWAGGGITLYGMAYLIVHDIFIHERFKFFGHTNNWYLRALRKAHKIHHKKQEREHGECFGMLWVPLKYYFEALKSGKK